jgi:hypothetical protein
VHYSGKLCTSKNIHMEGERRLVINTKEPAYIGGKLVHSINISIYFLYDLVVRTNA